MKKGPEVDDKNMILKYGGFLLFCAILLSACSSYDSHMDMMLKEYNCERDARYTVDSGRKVIFFVKHHIMVGDREPVDNHEEAIGFIRTPKEKISWENNRFAAYRKETIPALMHGVNEILYDNDTNIFLVTDDYELNTAAEFFPADFDLLSRPQGHTRAIMEAMVARDPEYIHILYGWTSSTAVVVAGEQFAVVVADDPRYGLRVNSLELTREIINSLGYQPKVGGYSTYNLLHHTATGDGMSSEQISALWDVVNENGQALKSISCVKGEKEVFWDSEE